MSGLQDQNEHCEKCNKSFSSWEAFLIHKIQSKKHISCLFCGRDFNTLEGCSRHQLQNHSTVQELYCAGCGEEFVRAGSYINHIELQMCPVIHHSILEAKRVEKEKKLLSERTVLATLDKVGQVKDEPHPAMDGNILCAENPDESPLEFHDPPKETSWDDWGDAETEYEHIQLPASTSALTPALTLDDFPVLPLQDYRNGGSKVPDLLTGAPDKLTRENLTWLAEKELFPLVPKPVDVQRPVAAMTNDPLTKEEEYHEFDPDNPKFDSRRFYIPILEKFRCPWINCKKSLPSRIAFIQHLKSPAHMNLKLRCPACMRQFPSATALVQHSEAQAVKCQIRESQQYKSAVECITGGFVDTEGRHKDFTVRYVAPANAIESNVERLNATLKAATNAYKAAEEISPEIRFKGLSIDPDW